MLRCCSLWPYLVVLGVLTMPWDVICPQALMLYKQGVWRLWRAFWSSLSAGISVWIDHQNFFVTEVSLKAQLSNYLIHCFIIHHSTLHQLLLLISTNKTYSKPAILPFKSCDWSHEYQFLSVHHEPVPASLCNHVFGQYRRTWPRPWYSGYSKVNFICRGNNRVSLLWTSIQVNCWSYGRKS